MRWALFAIWLVGCAGQSTGQPVAVEPTSSSAADTGNTVAEPASEAPPAQSLAVAPVCSESAAAAGEPEPTQCSATCTAKNYETTLCIDGEWQTKTTAAPCECGPAVLAAPLAQCKVEHMTILATELAASDGCELDLACKLEKLRVVCDGENDGTGTSLCECFKGDKQYSLGSPVPGEGASACLAGAARCVSSASRR